MLFWHLLTTCFSWICILLHDASFRFYYHIYLCQHHWVVLVVCFASLPLDCHNYLQYQVTLMMTSISEKDFRDQSVKYTRCCQHRLIVFLSTIHLQFKGQAFQLVPWVGRWVHRWATRYWTVSHNVYLADTDSVTVGQRGLHSFVEIYIYVQ